MVLTKKNSRRKSKNHPYVLLTKCLHGRIINVTEGARLPKPTKLVTDLKPGFWGLEVRWRNEFKACWTRFFSSFFAAIFFTLFDDFSKWNKPKVVLQNIWQKMKNSLVQLTIRTLLEARSLIEYHSLIQHRTDYSKSLIKTTLISMILAIRRFFIDDNSLISTILIKGKNAIFLE